METARKIDDLFRELLDLLEQCEAMEQAATAAFRADVRRYESQVEQTPEWLRKQRVHL